MKIEVSRKDGSTEIITLTEPLTVVRGEHFNILKTSTGMEHWFTPEGKYECDCVSFVRNSGIPTKVIVLKCRNCKTEYVLYPNGQIEYNLSSAAVTVLGTEVGGRP